MRFFRNFIQPSVCFRLFQLLLRFLQLKLRLFHLSLLLVDILIRSLRLAIFGAIGFHLIPRNIKPGELCAVVIFFSLLDFSIQGGKLIAAGIGSRNSEQRRGRKKNTAIFFFIYKLTPC